MRRALVLTTESSRHPFRASLPPHVLRRAGEVENAAPWRQRLGIARRDVELFGTTYVGGVIGTLTFLA